VVDRAYLESLPEFRTTLRRLRSEFSRLDTRTDWVGLRVDPLLRHVRSLEAVLRSPRFSKESARLRRGVSMFHSDLVYLRHNLRELEALLAVEKGRARSPRAGNVGRRRNGAVS
jgi:hypothetical protein